jgi:uncharacterized protein
VFLRKQALTLIILSILLTPTIIVGAQSRPGYVYDYAYLLDESEIGAIEDLCAEIDNNITAEVVAVILPNLNDYSGSIEMAKLEYFNDIPLEGITGIGKKGKDNGVLILIAVEEHEWAFEIGYGVEGELTDSESGRIGREVITPYFQQGEYYYGLFIAVAYVGEELGYDVENFDTPKDQYVEPNIIEYLFSNDPSLILWWLLGMGGDFVILLIIIIILAILFGARGGGLGGGRGGGGGRSGGGGSRGRW